MTAMTTVKNSSETKNLENYPELLQILLKNRGFETVDEAEKFLHPKYEDLSSPFSVNDMKKAVERILDAVEKKEKITIYADYDADGIPGAVILHDFFKKIGYENFDVYIPHRHHEGYGFHEKALADLSQRGTKLLITVDVGSVAVKESKEVKKLGMEVIITDHHEFQEELPEAFAIVHPKLGNYADPDLCGAGMAFRLVQALCLTLEEQGKGERLYDWSKWLLDMVAIATISDLVPLKNENRILAHYGMRVLRQTRRRGLLKLFEAAQLSLDHLIEDDISFTVAPRLNAASRMAHPIDAFNVLASPAGIDVHAAVLHLVKLNDERKLLVARTMKEAKKTLVERELGEVIVIGHPAWNLGILGLVATKITEEYGKPSFVWGVEEGGLVKGSCRGCGEADVVKLMESISTTFIQFGGHSMAGGFSLKHEEVHFLEERLLGASALTPKAVKISAEVFTECSLTLSQVTKENYDLISKCAPFGTGNPKPIFKFENIVLQDIRTFGKGKDHIELSFKDEKGRTIKAIQFFKVPEDFTVSLVPGKTITLLASFDYSVYRGRTELRLRIVDILEN